MALSASALYLWFEHLLGYLLAGTTGWTIRDLDVQKHQMWLQTAANWETSVKILTAGWLQPDYARK